MRSYKDVEFFDEKTGSDGIEKYYMRIEEMDSQIRIETGEENGFVFDIPELRSLINELECFERLLQEKSEA